MFDWFKRKKRYVVNIAQDDNRQIYYVVFEDTDDFFVRTFKFRTEQDAIEFVETLKQYPKYYESDK